MNRLQYQSSSQADGHHKSNSNKSSPSKQSLLNGEFTEFQLKIKTLSPSCATTFTTNERSTALDYLMSCLVTSLKILDHHQTKDEIEKHESIIKSIINCISELLQGNNPLDHQVKYNALSSLNKILSSQTSHSRIANILKDYAVFLLPSIVSSLSDFRTSVRGRAPPGATTLKMIASLNPPDTSVSMLKSVIDNGLYSSNDDLRQATCIILPSLLTPALQLDFLYQGYPPLIKEDEASSTCLAATLMAAIIQYLHRSELQEVLLQSLNTLRLQIGDESFVEQLDKLPRKLQKAYLEACREFSNRRIYQQSSQTSLRLSQSSSVEQLDQVSGLNSSFTQDSCSTPRNLQNNSAPADPSWRTRSNIVAGFIPIDVKEHLSNGDSKMRFKAVEQMRNSFEELCTKKRCSDVLLANMSELIPILQDLLSDSNFHIVKTTLEMLAGIVGKSSVPAYGGSDTVNIRSYSNQLVAMLLKSLGDNKKVVQMWVMRYAMTLMRQLETEFVLSQLGQVGLYHRNSRIRQETIDIIIGALLQFPSGDFDLDRLCQLVAPTLADRKQTVRQASQECIAVLAHLLGAGKLEPLIEAIDDIDRQMYSKSQEQTFNEIVKQRLARHQLPRLTNQGLVEYAITRTESRVNSASMNPNLIAITHEGTPNLIKREASDIMEATRRHSGAKAKGLFKLPWESESSFLDRTSESREKISTRTDSFSSGTQSIRSSNSSFMDLPKSDDMIDRDRSLVNRFNKPPIPDIFHSSKSMPCSGKTSPQNFVSDLECNYASISHREVANHDQHYKNDQQSSQVDTPTSSAKGRSKTLLSEDNPFPTKPTLIRSARKRQDSATSSRTNSAESRVISGYSTTSRETSASVFSDNLPSLYSDKFQTIASDHSASSGNKPRSNRSQQDSGFSSRGTNLIYTEVSSMTCDEMESRDQSVNNQNEDPNQMDHSLMSIRNSANRKKVATRKKAMEETLKQKELERMDTDMQMSAARSQAVNAESPTSPTSYSPYSGATFKANPNYNGLVVGKGYTEDNPPNLESESLTNQIDSKPYDKRKQPIKGTASTSRMGSTSSSTSKNSFDSDDQASAFNQTNEEIFNVIGKRMFDNSGRWDSEKLKPKPPDISNEEWRATQYSDPHNVPEKITAEPNRSQRPPAAPKCQSRRKSNAHTLLMPSSRAMHRSRSENQLNDVSTLSSSAMSTTVASVDLSSANQEDSARSSSPLIPLPQPTKSIPTALELLGKAEWEKNIDGLKIIQRLVQFHSDVLANRSVDLHQIQFAVCVNCKNLRSQVSRMAIQTLGCIYNCLKKACDTDLEHTVKILLIRSAETNAFIREDVSAALSAMIDSVTPQRAIAALIHTGANHKSSIIRRTCVFHLSQMCQMLGPGRVLSGIKEITDRILSSVGNFVTDSNPETRYFGRKILHDLMHHQDFDKYLKKSISSNQYKSVKDVVDSLKTKGLGVLPQSCVRRSTSLSRDVSARSSVRSLSGSGPMKYGSSQDIPSEQESSVQEDSQDPVSNIMLLMSSQDWRQRIRGVQELSNLIEEDQLLVTSNINQIFEKLCPRLSDSNSKVTQIALQTLSHMMPQISGTLSPHATGSIVQHTVANLASSNSENSMSASNILDALIDCANSAYVLASLIQSLSSASNRMRVQLWFKVTELTYKILNTKDLQESQRIFIRHLYPEFFKQLQEIEKRQHEDQALIESLRSLVSTLYLYLGEDLIERAKLTSPSVVDLLEELINLDSGR